MMCCCLLLLLTLTSCVCEPTFVVKVTQSSYQAEENHNITLDWTFTTNTQGSSELLSVNCRLFTDDHKEPKVLYHLHEGVEDPDFLDEQFSGRVQCDRDVLREGRVRLHVSRLKTEDSGRYQCHVLNELGRSSDECHLNVTAAVDEPGPETPGPETPGPETPGPERPGPEDWGMVAVYVAVAAAVVVVVGRLSYFVYRHRIIKKSRNARLAARTQMV